MRVLSVCPFKKINIFNRKQRNVAQDIHTVAKKQMPKLEQALNIPWINELRQKTYYDTNLHRECSVYSDNMLKIIAGMDEKSNEKAKDIARRFENVEGNPKNLPKDWNYILEKYDTDYEFIQKFDKRATLAKIEAMFHVKEQLPEDYHKYAKLNADTIYKFLEVQKESPEQINEILKNDDFVSLFMFIGNNETSVEEIKNFGKSIEESPESMHKVLKVLCSSERDCMSNCSSCTPSEAIEFAKMMKKDPDLTTKFIKRYPGAEPEVLKIFLKYGNETDVEKEFEIYTRIFNPIRIEQRKRMEDWDTFQEYCLSYPQHVEEKDLKDIDNFLGSKYLTRLKDTLIKKSEEYKGSFNWDLKEARVHYIFAKDDLREFLKGVTESYDPIPSNIVRNKKITQGIVRNDRELFLKLIEDNILAKDFSSANYDKIVEFYHNNRDKNITREMLKKHLGPDVIYY